MQQTEILHFVQNDKGVELQNAVSEIFESYHRHSAAQVLPAVIQNTTAVNGYAVRVDNTDVDFALVRFYLSGVKMPNLPANKLKVIKVSDALMCVRCDNAFIADVITGDGAQKKMFYCSRLDCDNWVGQRVADDLEETDEAA